MYKESWGLKRICPMCRSSYYDLGRTILECPSCGKEIEVANLARPRRGRKPGSVKTLAVSPAEVQNKPKEDIGDDDIENIENGDDKTDDAVIEDDTVLIEEDNDIDPSVDAGIKSTETESKDDL